MAYIHRLGFFLILTACGLTVAWFYKQPSQSLENYIQLQARRDSAYEYPKARKFVFGDIDGDGMEDVAVLYTLEGVRGGIDWLQFLAVNLSSQGGSVICLQVGGKDIREIDEVRVVKGALQLTIREYAPSDASCCPSLPSTKRLIVQGSQIVAQ